MNPPRRPSRRNNFFFELWWLTCRCLKAEYRDSSQHLTRLVQLLTVSISVALLFRNVDVFRSNQETVQDVAGFLYVYVSQCTFPFTYASLWNFPKELPRASREISDGFYRPLPFYVAKVMGLAPIQFATVSVVTIVMHSSPRLGGGDGGYLSALAIGYLLCLTCSAFGTMLSMVFKNPANASTTVGVTDALAISLSGFFLKFSALPRFLAWIRWLSWTMYGFTALVTKAWHGVEHLECSGSARKTLTGAATSAAFCLEDGAAVIKYYELESDPSSFLGIQTTCVVGLSSLCLGFHAIGFILFRRNVKHAC